MSEYKYTKSYSTDFSSVLVNHQLAQAIEAESAITETLIRIDRDDDVVDIVFDVEPSSGNKTLIDGLIANHSNVITEEPDDQIIMIPKKDSYKNKSYTQVVVYEYIGNNTKRIVDISVCSWIDKNNSEYSIQIVDDTNDNIIGTSTFTNTNIMSNYIKPLTNIPTNKATISIHVISPNKDTVYIESVNVYFKY